MKRYSAFIILIFIIVSGAFSSTIDSTKIKPNYWTPIGTVGLNVSQMAFSDWAQGGDALFAWSLSGNFGIVYNDSIWRFGNNLKMAYGITKTGQNGNSQTKINDNEIYFESILSYNMGWAADPYISNTFRSVIDQGFDYKKTPKEQISGFLDPGYFTQSIGFTYNRLGWMSSRLGFGFQEVLADSFAFKYTDNPNSANFEKFKFDTGIESVIESKFLIDSNITYSGMLRLFSKFDQLDVWDIRNDNTITAKINKYFNVNLNVLILYERKMSLRTQIKEALQLGVAYNLF